MNWEELSRVFTAPFVNHLGVRLVEAGEGWCLTEMPVGPVHLQQDGFVHAGVQATLADHTAGAAATTLVALGEAVLTVEFKLNLLRPAQGERLRCRAQVLRGGRTLSVVESEVHTDRLVAKATVTLAIVRSVEREG
ncbi:PaaI family thioesterase [Thermus sp. FJN-A]